MLVAVAPVIEVPRMFVAVAVTQLPVVTAMTPFSEQTATKVAPDGSAATWKLSDDVAVFVA